MVSYYVCGAFMYTVYYLICMYWAIIYKDMGIAVFCSRTLTRN